MTIDHWNVVRDARDATTVEEHIARLYWELAELRVQVSRMTVSMMRGLPLGGEMEQDTANLEASLDETEKQLEARLRDL